MVKLLKHELIALFRVLVFFAAAVVVFAVLGRIMLAVDIARVQSGDQNGIILSIIFILFYVFAICALVIAAWALGVSRFYKTLFTGEGYLTLSLPVSPMGIIWAKLLSSIIAMFAACIVSVLSLCIFLVGLPWGLLSELGVEIALSLQMWGDSIVAAPGLFVEQLILFIVGVPVSLLLVYTCISLGQLFTHHRKLMIFVIVLVLYILIQIGSAYILSPITAALSAAGQSVHLLMWLEILLVAATDVGCFFLIRYILKNKVNFLV